MRVRPAARSRSCSQEGICNWQGRQMRRDRNWPWHVGGVGHEVRSGNERKRERLKGGQATTVEYVCARLPSYSHNRPPTAGLFPIPLLLFGSTRLLVEPKTAPYSLRKRGEWRRLIECERARESAETERKNEEKGTE